MTSQTHRRTHRSLVKAGVLAAAVSLLAGCSTFSDWFGGSPEKDAIEPVELTEFNASAKVVKMWSAKADANPKIGVVQSPTVVDGRVYIAGQDGRVRSLELQTGQQQWEYRAEMEFVANPGAGDGFVVVGSLEGDVVGLDALTGEQKWTAKVPGEVVTAPTVGQGLVLVHGNDGRVTAFDVTNGQRRWFWNRDLPTLSVRGNDGVVLGPGYVFVGNDDGTVVALSLNDGRPLWEQAIGQPDGRTELDRMADVDGTPSLDGAILFATSFKRVTMAIEAPSGRPLWAQEQGGRGRVGIALDRVVVSDVTGSVWALDKNGGTAVWQQSGLLRRAPTGAAIHGDYAVVGDYDGYLHWLRLDNGDFGARIRMGGELRGAPVVANGVLVAQSAEGEVAAFRFSE